MKNILQSKLPAALLGIVVAVLCSPALPDDIDLFTNAQSGSSSNPNILFVLDNSANWSSNHQLFPSFTYNGQSGTTEGQAEVAAIASALTALGSQAANVNVGLMIFESKQQTGGQIGYAVQAMTPTNLSNFENILTNSSAAIFNHINDPQYKVGSTLPYGGIMEDAYNYFAGKAPTFYQYYNPPPNIPLDPNGYAKPDYSLFKAPGGSGCNHNYIIFIGNTPDRGTVPDDGANEDPNNTAQLAALGGSTTQPAITQFVTGTINNPLGSSSLCYANTSAGQSSCTTTEPGLNPGYGTQCAGYSLGCSCTATSSTALPSCSSIGAASGTARYSVLGLTNTTNTSTSSSSKTTPNTSTGTQTSCIADTTATVSTTCAASNKTPSPTPAPTCPSTAASCSWVNTGASCGTKGNTVTWNYQSYTLAPPSSPSCPAASTVNTAGPGSNQSTTTVTNWSSCYSSTATSCGTNSHSFAIFGTQTVNTTVTTTTVTGTQPTTLGNEVACTTSANCTTSDYSNQSSNYNGGLACSTTSSTQTGTCPSGEVTYQVQGSFTGETPSTAPPSVIPNKYLPLNANLWAQFMYQQGVATTFTIDVYNQQPDAIQSAVLNSMALLGGGSYYAAQNYSSITNKITTILQEIQAVNSTFAAAALPVNATNRAQNQNQVYIGQFRPDPESGTRWFGNLKRYQLIYNTTTASTDLGDVNGNEAIGQTGFLDDCAVSWWTTAGTTNYWKSVTDDHPAPGGVCGRYGYSYSSANFDWSDIPDGPIVEKGAVSEVLRSGNATSGGTSTSDPATTRNMFTLSGGSPVAFNATNVPSLSQQVINFTLGEDVYGEASGGSPSSSITTTVSTAPRPSIHGDVIHSRPLPVNYSGSSGGVSDVVFYGDNDGPYRAVNAATGQEMWSFIAPEFLNKLNRQMLDSPKVGYYPTEPNTKDYFFDGSTGLYEATNSSRVWIYPSMRRGGRMIYAFDVTNPVAKPPTYPPLLWRVGCPDLGDNLGCTTDKNNISMSGMGQTWSVPNAAFIKGYTATNTTSNPDSAVVIAGGGYDPCEDPDTATPSCGNPTGNVIYVLDGYDGHVIQQFATARSVAADVSLVDVDGDGFVDYAYAADTGGNIYRINFVNNANTPLSAPTTPSTTPVSASSNTAWGITKVAYMDASTPSTGRKFLFGPALLAVSGSSVYVALGSGDREHPLISEYPVKTPVKNRFYVYLDNVASTPTTATDLDTDTAMENADPVNGKTDCSVPAPVLPGKSGKGWYLDLAGTGEETVTSALIFEGQVAFSTNTPTSPASGACTSLGTAQGYLVNLFNGSGAIGNGICGGTDAATFPGGGLPPSPVLAEVPVNINGTMTTELVTIGVAQKNGGVISDLQSQNVTQVITGPRKGVFWKKSGDN